MIVQKRKAFSRNQSSKFGFGSFPRLALCGVMLLLDAGQWQPPGSHVITRVNSQHTGMLVVTFRTVFNKVHERFSISF